MANAIYAGTFDPITNGHIDIVERALKIFDKIIVAVADEPKKSLFTVEERVEMIKEATKGMNVEVDHFNGLLVDFAKKKNIQVIIRGLRAISDFEFELQMAHFNRNLNKDVDTVFIMTATRYSFVNSTAIKEVVSLGGEVSSLVPEIVDKKLKQRYSK